MIIAKSISHRAPLLTEVSIQLMPGMLTGIVGPNGAGKSTLLRVLAGLLTPTSGHCTIDDRCIFSLKPMERARQIAYLEQYAFVHWPLTSHQLIQLGRFPHHDQSGNSPDIDREVVSQVIRELGIESIAARAFNALSGGERARVLLARALAVKADHLLVDEPIASLDMKYQFEIMQLLAGQARSGRCVGVIIHDLSLAAQYCDQIYLMNNSEVVDSGTPGEVFNEKNIKQVFDINAKVILGDNGITIQPLG